MRGRFRILIVDDNDSMLRSMSSMLRDQYFIDTAMNNSQGWSQFTRLPYDLVSLDINMPDFDGIPNRLAGINLLEKLRKFDPSVPAIIWTGEEEKTIRTMLEAKNIKGVDLFQKDKRGERGELYRTINRLVNESETSVRAVGETGQPVSVSFKRKDIVNLQGVVSKIENDYEGQVFIIEREGVLPELLGTHWLVKAGYGKLREEPVEIIGVQGNKFVVIGLDQVTFLRDCYRNEILVHKTDLEGLVGTVVDFDEKMKRVGVQITSGHAPDYLTSKSYWQAITDDGALLPISTKVDILGEKDNKLRIRPGRILIYNEKGQEFEVVKAGLAGLVGKVVRPVDEESRGSIRIISATAFQPLNEERWQAVSEDEKSIFIPGEQVEVAGIKDKKLQVREYLPEE